jgi:hypothetical protein
VVTDTVFSTPTVILRSDTGGVFSIGALDGTTAATIQYAPSLGMGIGTFAGAGFTSFFSEGQNVMWLGADGLDISDVQNPAVGYGVKTGAVVGGVSVTSNFMRFGGEVVAVSVLDATKYFEISSGGTIYKLALIA